MALPNEAYQAFQSIVGPDFVSDDPAIVNADRPKGRLKSKEIKLYKPVCSIEPETTEEVQGIIKVCNRYGLPFAATSSLGSDPPGVERQNVVFIDLKRMRKLVIDDDNLFAIVEPGIASAVLQGELMKRGLMTFVPMSGGECSVLANASYIGEGAVSWKLGDRGYRRVLSVEWVTPDGEILNLGSTSMSENNYFWGEGPGPDLRGLLISSGYGSAARKGVITKMGVRVFPFIKEKMEPVGDAPSTALQMPANRFAWYNFIFPSRKAAVDAIFEIGKCEIGLLCMTVPPWFFSMAKARSTGGEKLTGAAAFWDDWNNVTGPAAKENPEKTTTRALLYGIGSDKRLAYEEKVLQDICASFGVVAKKSRSLSDATHFMSADAIVSNLAGGRFASMILFESIDHDLKGIETMNRNTKKHVPPIFEDYGTTNWFVPFEMAHICKEESLRFTTVQYEDALTLLMADVHQDFVKQGGFPMLPVVNFYRQAWGDYPAREKKIFQIIDPNHLAPLW
jgi:hypothetical protein